jgi:hypothetical protein
VKAQAWQKLNKLIEYYEDPTILREKERKDGIDR